MVRKCRFYGRFYRRGPKFISGEKKKENDLIFDNKTNVQSVSLELVM